MIIFFLTESFIFIVLCYILLRQIVPEYFGIGEHFFFSVIIWFVNINCIAFILALSSHYAMINVLIVMFLQCCILMLFMRKNLHLCIKLSQLKQRAGTNKRILILFACCFLLYSIFPTNYLWARRDPALYLISAVNIADTGSPHVETSSFLNKNYEEIKEFVSLEYRGMNPDYETGQSHRPGDLTIQFLHFFPSLLAIGYSLGGLPILIRVNSIVAILCIGTVYFLCKRFLSKRTAEIAAIFLAFNPAQIWGARITQTELLFQLWVLIGCYLFALAWKKESKIMFFLSGFAIGAVGFNRIDSYVLGAGLLTLCCYYNLFYIKYLKSSFILAGGYILTSVASFIYSMVYSPYYIKSHWDVGVLQAVIYLNLGLILCVLLTTLIGLKFHKQLNKYNFVAWCCDQKKIRIAFCSFLFTIFLVLYYVRPLFQEGRSVDDAFSQRSMVEFCWYTSFFIIPLFIFGLFKILIDNKKRHMMLLLIGIGFSSLAVYLYRPAIAPDHIWASRRWVSACFPVIFILAAYGIDNVTDLLRRKHTWIKYVPLIITALITGYLLYQSRLFLFTPMLSELPDAYEELSEQLDDDTVYFAEQSHFASILRFVYGKNVYVLKEKSADKIIEYLKGHNEPFYYLGSNNDLDSGLELTLLFDGDLTGTYIDQTMGSYPTNLVKTGSDVNLYGVSLPGEINNHYAEHLEKKGVLVPKRSLAFSDAVPGYISYGPYMRFPRGDYEVQLELRSTIEPPLDQTEEILGYCDVSYNKGLTVLGQVPIKKELFIHGVATVTIPFTLNSEYKDIEFRVYAEREGISVESITYRQYKNSFTPGQESAERIGN